MSDSRNKDVLPLYSLLIANLSNPNLLKLSDKEQDRIVTLADKLIADNETMLIRDPTVGLSSLTFDAKGAALAPIITNATYNYMLGRVDLAGFQKEVAAWRDAGGNEITSEFKMAYANAPR
ncbi:hypothetical protein [Gordoniibacillus kamchatkensis]|uniref:hypothetical protein n=1 Tax=Gordoniibacillus kamchatkensis TaxID=1590651 RepID=UPI0006973D85|nr:hypothetical protein [Paenibacillus sp. VKM B-2647]